MAEIGRLSGLPPIDPRKAASPKAKMPPSLATIQYPAAVGVGTNPTIGLLSPTDPAEPWNAACPKLKTPPSAPASQYPEVPEAVAGARNTKEPTTAVTISTTSPRAAPRLATALRKPLLATGSLRPKRTVRLLSVTATSTATSTIRGYETTISSQRPRNNTPLTGRSRNYPSHTARVEARVAEIHQRCTQLCYAPRRGIEPLLYGLEGRCLIHSAT